ncbi:MAG: mechanosensitive ion channel [Sporomusaceae bacterium]|nr:mechanosensitive ion channel [Sporomusaceae bacterium]
MQFDYLPEQFNQLAAYGASHALVYKLAGSLLIFLIFLLLRNLFTRYIFQFILNLTHRSRESAEASFLPVLRDPVKHMIVLIGAYLALQNYLSGEWKPFLNDLFRTGTIFLFAGAVYALIGYYAGAALASQRIFNYEVDKILVPFFSKVLRLIALALAFVAIASTWGYDVNGFIAGLGLGGLAFALAAKDLLANIFSGIVIITDKTFSIGDWIKTDSVEGMIENISFRSTRIRAFDQSVITVPNSSLVNAPIINFTKRSLRRVTFQLRVVYDTPAYSLNACANDIERLLRTHPDVDQNMIFVKFDGFGETALELFIYYFTKTIVWGDYLTIKQDINFKIMQIMEKHGVQFALPSSTVYLERRQPRQTE